jgi:hypothetical protein
MALANITEAMSIDLINDQFLQSVKSVISSMFLHYPRSTKGQRLDNNKALLTFLFALHGKAGLLEKLWNELGKFRFVKSSLSKTT